ncbi:S1/P1 nuclease [Bradyrhizobium sp. CCBAU 53380]|uniref:S1/P1 nuclease n=1 Tax=Bradyrhizobium sp. CCBAU 53380 TaxID=1325117 RepID=UPI0023034DC5|nr:S1/P1 nuclease [Bradyrhizobium sp. CCBAU 53380]MDA9420993.1 hypothetical protein [Bradyrhizobium sp. CCBAU 53380]
MRRFSLAAVFLLAFCTHASAWGDEGHKIVCEIAYRLAQPDTRAAIRKLIQADKVFDTFSDSCVFPDHPRIRRTEHFINLPRDSHGVTGDNCPNASECVLTAILNDSKVVNSKHAKRADRLIALKSLGHWVGDIHQPLHVSFEDDRGGNDIRVNGECSGNLHGTWDSCLVTHAVGSDVDEAASDLIDAITPAMKTKWSSSDPGDWANESFAISKSVKTGYCVMHGSSCDQPEGSVNVSAHYLAANEPIVREQLQKAGVRLAALLDSIFAD